MLNLFQHPFETRAPQFIATDLNQVQGDGLFAPSRLRVKISFPTPFTYVPMWFMTNELHEPQPPTPAPRACSTPHSSPIAWLKSGSEGVGADDKPANPPAAFEACPEPGRGADLDIYAGDAPARRNGWTPFARKLFLTC